MRRIIIAAALAIAALLIPVSQLAAAGTSGGAAGHGPKPSIVLVHGAWADSSSWDAVAGRSARRIHRLCAAEPAAWPDL